MILHPGDTCAKEGNVSRLRVTVDGLEGGHHLLGGGAEDLVLVGNLGDGVHYPGEDLGQLGVVGLRGQADRSHGRGLSGGPMLVILLQTDGDRHVTVMVCDRTFDPGPVLPLISHPQNSPDLDTVTIESALDTLFLFPRNYDVIGNMRLHGSDVPLRGCHS